MSKQHLPRMCLILVMGVAGSGKSTLARKILRRIRAVYLDNNHIVDAFFPHSRNGPAYEKLRPRLYAALYTVAEENLRAGNSVLLDVPHVKESQDPRWRHFITNLAARTKSELVVIRCFCSEKTLHARLRSRGENRDRWKLNHWKEFLAQQPIRASLPFPHLEVDTQKNLAANLRAATRYILQPQPKRLS